MNFGGRGGTLTIDKVKVAEITEWRVESPERGTTPEARLCLGAAMLISRDGWRCDGLYGSRQVDEEDPRGRCLSGAMAAAQNAIHGPFLIRTSEMMTMIRARQVLQALLTATMVEDFGSSTIETWNDHFCKSTDEAVRVLLNAADAMEV